MMKVGIAFLLAAMVVGIANARDRAMPQFTRINTPTIANFGPGCRIRLLLPDKSELKAYYGSEEHLGSGGLIVPGMPYQDNRSLVGFRCLRAGDDRVNGGWAIFDPDKGWRPNIDPPVEQLISFGAFHYYDLTSMNAKGWGVVADDISGDERFRSRKFSYCLIRKSKAICGQDYEMGYLPDIKRNSRSDLTPYVLDLLRTVEFLDDAPPLDASTEKP